MCGVERGILIDGFLPFAGSVGRSLAGCDKGILAGIDGDSGNYGIPRCNTLSECDGILLCLQRSSFSGLF